MKFTPILMALVLLVAFSLPVGSYPENFFEVTGSGYEPISYTPIQNQEMFLAAGEMDTNFRILWFDTEASIPSGWERDTTFDGNFLQGVSTDPIATHLGGSHDHNGIHNHDLAAHTHTITGSSTTGSTIGLDFDFGGQLKSGVTHSHNATASTAQAPHPTQNNTMQGTETDLNNAIPPNVTAIIIKPTGTADIPINGAVFTDETSIPDFDSISNDFNTLFIRVAGTGADGNGTGGSLVHNHFDADHNHTNVHKHPDSQVGLSNSSIRGQPNLLLSNTRNRSHHNLAGNFRSVDTNDSAVQYGETEFEPFYTKLLVVENKSGGAITPTSVITMYVGSIDSISSSWVLADGTGESNFDLTDTQIRITTGVNEIGETGGNNNVSHNSIGEHPHDSNSHNQTPGSVTDNGITGVETNTSSFLSIISHAHTWTYSNENPGFDSNSVTTTSDDARFNYKQVLFVKRVVTDTCTYTGSGDWIINCEDACLIVQDVDVKGNKLVLINEGGFDVNAIIKRVTKIEWPENPNICSVRVYVLESGGFEFEQAS
jgi:hypothetical protein